MRARGFCAGCLPKRFSSDGGRQDCPDAFHLLAAIHLLHQFVIEFVTALFALGGPDNRLRGVGEVAAGEIWRRIGLDPGNVVEQLEAELLHGEAHGMNDVAGAADPDGAVGFEDALAGGEPGAVEFVIFSPRPASGPIRLC